MIHVHDMDSFSNYVWPISQLENIFKHFTTNHEKEAFFQSNYKESHYTIILFNE